MAIGAQTGSEFDEENLEALIQNEIRQALDYTTLRAVGTFGLAAVLVTLLMLGLSVAPFPL